MADYLNLMGDFLAVLVVGTLTYYLYSDWRFHKREEDERLNPSPLENLDLGDLKTENIITPTN